MYCMLSNTVIVDPARILLSVCSPIVNRDKQMNQLLI